MKSNNPLFGTIAMTAANTVRVAVQIAILPVIGRILGPHAYGQIALVSPFIFFAMLLAESGLGACILRTDKLSDALEGTVFCFSAGLSILIILLFAALAFPLGYLLHEPLFPYLLMGMSSILLMASFNIVPAALLMRSKNYGWIALSDIASSIGGIAAITIGLLLDWGVWSLVFQQVVFWLCKVAVVMIGSRYRPRFLFHRSIIAENMRFGANLTGASILTFFAKNIDNVLIGAFLGAKELGYYALAFQIVSLPSMVLSSSLYFTLFSAACEARRSGNMPSSPFLRVMRLGLLISAPALIGIAVTSPLSVPLVLGEKWLPMIPLIMLLTLFGLTQTMITTTSGIIIGSGRSDVTFRLTLISASTTIIAIILGAFISSSVVALGVSLAALVAMYLALRAVVRICGIDFNAIYKALAAPLVCAMSMGCAVILLQWLMPHTVPMWSAFIISIMAGILVYGLILFGLFREHLAEDVADIKKIIFKKMRQTI